VICLVYIVYFSLAYFYF